MRCEADGRGCIDAKGLKGSEFEDDKMADDYGAIRVSDRAGDGEMDPVQPEQPPWPTGVQMAPKPINTYRGLRRQCGALERKERAFIALTVLSLAAMTFLTLYKVCTVSDRDADFTFGLVLLVNFVFCIAYAVFGVLQERFTLIAPLCADVILIFVYLLVNYLYGKRDDVKLARLIIAGVNLVLVFVPGFYLGCRYYPSGKVLMNAGGAGPAQALYRDLYVCFDLLLFDLQLSISMVLFTMTSRRQFDTEDGVVLGVGLAVASIWFLLSQCSLRKELKPLAWIALAMFWIQPAYVCWRMCETKGYEATHFPGLAIPIFVCGAVAQLTRYCVAAFGLHAYRNFNKGLKDAAHGVFSAQLEAAPYTRM